MIETPGAPVAVLLHLASARVVADFEAALSRLRTPHELFVNLPVFAGTKAHPDVRRRVAEAFPTATVMESENRGMDVGGMLQLFRSAIPGGYRYLLYMHSKSDDAWRRSMIDALVGRADQALAAMRQPARGTSRKPIGMVGAWSYPFDYYNIGRFLDLMTDLGVEVETTWERYFARYPQARDLPLPQRIAHSLHAGRPGLRPEVDIDYARANLGDPFAAEQPMSAEKKARLIADRVMGPLPYFPGNFFWIRAELVRALAATLDLETEIRRLPRDLASDRELQSRAHAWERALPVFAASRGYALLALGAR